MFDIDLVRYVLEKKVNDNRISFFSFYEPLNSLEQVDRYKENLQAIINEQNGLNDNDAFAILRASSMEITNLKSNYISSFSVELNVKTYAMYRDRMVKKFKNVIKKEINGRKFDLVVDENGNTYFYEEFSSQSPKENTFIGYNKDFGQFTNEYLYANKDTIKAEFNTYLSGLYGVDDISLWNVYVLINNKNLYKLGSVLEYIGEVELYKADFNFTDFECDTPSDFNSDEIINITCTGNCTICDDKVTLGNDLTKFEVNGIECEPIGLNGSYSAGSVTSQLTYKENKYMTVISNSITYSFVVDLSNEIVKELYNIARQRKVLPNNVYEIKETTYNYGIETTNTFKAKLIKCTYSNNSGDIIVITTDFLVGDY